MTREEAINNLNMISVAFVEAETKEQRKIIDDTFNMAIKALEQEPCEDAISRKDVLNQIFYSTDNSGDVVLDSVLRRRIENLPSVKPQEQKSEKWIKSLIYENIYNCSKCGSAGYDTFNYCPNCGAKMKVGE